VEVLPARILDLDNQPTPTPPGGGAMERWLEAKEAVRTAGRKSGKTPPAGDADRAQTGDDLTTDRPAKDPTEKYTIVKLREMTGLENGALNKYAKLAGVPTAGRGKRNHALTADQTQLLLKKMVEVCTTNLTRDRCSEALENLLQIRMKSVNPQQIG